LTAVFAAVGFAAFAVRAFAGLAAAGFDAAAGVRAGVFADLRLTAALVFALAKLRSSQNLEIHLQGRGF
jgi:hypothetical protein